MDVFIICHWIKHLVEAHKHINCILVVCALERREKIRFLECIKSFWTNYTAWPTKCCYLDLTKQKKFGREKAMNDCY